MSETYRTSHYVGIITYNGFVIIRIQSKLGAFVEQNIESLITCIDVNLSFNVRTRNSSVCVFGVLTFTHKMLKFLSIYFLALVQEMRVKLITKAKFQKLVYY